MLKELIKVKGVKQRFIADKLGVSEVTVSNWVMGKTFPSEENLEKLCKLLDIPVEKIKNVL
jgi:transcriptional regulator with XRE-family HTH domain